MSSEQYLFWLFIERKKDLFKYGSVMFIFRLDLWCWLYTVLFLLGLKMAFFNRVGSILKQSVSKHSNLELSASNASLFQAIRSMSSSKLFVGGERILSLCMDLLWFFNFFWLLYNGLLSPAGLSYGTDESSLKEAFSQYGDVIEGTRVIIPHR